MATDASGSSLPSINSVSIVRQIANQDVPLQQARRYATESAPKSGGSNPIVLIGGAAAVLGGGYYYMNSAPAKVPVVPAKPAFTGGEQGFLSLKVTEVEDVNHNTKRVRFELPEKDMVSGLNIASAVLTKFKGENDAKPTLRPYTPISDEGALLFFCG